MILEIPWLDRNGEQNNNKYFEDLSGVEKKELYEYEEEKERFLLNGLTHSWIYRHWSLKFYLINLFIQINS